MGGQPLEGPFPQGVLGQDADVRGLHGAGERGEARVEFGRGLGGDPPDRVVAVEPPRGPVGGEGRLSDAAQPAQDLDAGHGSRVQPGQFFGTPHEERRPLRQVDEPGVRYGQELGGQQDTLLDQCHAVAGDDPPDVPARPRPTGHRKRLPSPPWRHDGRDCGPSGPLLPEGLAGQAQRARDLLQHHAPRLLREVVLRQVLVRVEAVEGRERLVEADVGDEGLEGAEGGRGRGAPVGEVRELPPPQRLAGSASTR